MSVPTTSKNAVAAGNAAPAAQATPTQTDLRYYLLLPEVRRKGDKHREAFERFLRMAEFLFALREAAIVRFRENRWLARCENAALPLTWEAVGAVLSPERKEPRAGLETTLARTLPPVLQAVFERLRKVLRRERELQGLGRVEQIDPTCLRWLTRQPGYTVAQKAGARQQVLAVVRREHYDLLENRVLRDLLLRTERLAERWLEKEEEAFPAHESVKGVKRLLALCRGGLALEPLQGVSPLHEVPSPNYVLAQDALYRRIWDVYLLVVQYYRLVEDLWVRRGELRTSLVRWWKDAARYRGRFYRSELWVCPIKEGQPWVEDYPHFADETPARAPLLTRRAGDVTIDLLGMRLADVLLVPDGRHPNAKPRLIDLDAPYVDFDPEAEEENRSRGRYLVDVLRGADKDTPSEEARRYLYAYFEQLHGLLGGERWTILVADNWTPEWLEAIRQAAVLALGAQDRVFLLWRTIAYALGLGEPRAHVEVPRLCSPQIDGAKLEYKDGRPCHRAYRYHPECFDKHEELPAHPKKRTLFDWLWAPSKIDKAVEDILWKGADTFWKRRNNVAYWDELMGLYVVYQTADEHVRFRTLVQYCRYFKGGDDYEGDENHDFNLKDSSGLRLFLLEAEQADARAPLMEYSCSLRGVAGSDPLRMWAKASPGQGVVHLEIDHPSLQHPEELALEGLKPTKHTLFQLENEFERSFPPISPKVMADASLLKYYWERQDILAFARGEAPCLDGGLFYKPRYRYPLSQSLPPGVSPLERLRRLNVFGAEEGYRYPHIAIRSTFGEQDFQTLFRRLNEQALREVRQDTYNGALRLIAWTYQHDNPLFMGLRKICVELVCSERRSDPELITFCANLCDRPSEWGALFDSCIEFFKNDGVGCAERQRLLAHLLMFNADFIPALNLNRKPKTISFLVRKLVPTSISAAGAPQRNNCLRALLYLLRIRQFDGKRFAMKGIDDSNYDNIANACPLGMYWRKDNQHTQAFRKALHHYLNGNGRLEYIPQD